MAITATIIYYGVFSLIVVGIFIIVGLKILLKYWKAKDKNFILTGIAWFGISEPWWPSAISFLVALFNDTGISIEAYIIINCAFLPFFLTLWLIVMTDLIQIRNKTTVIIVNSIISGILEILIFYFLFTDISMVGEKLSPVDVDLGPITQLFFFYILSVFLITGFLFSIKTIKLNDPKPRLRGKFLLLAFTLFLIGAVMEIIMTMIINRIIILSCVIVFYVGFIMPERIEKIFLKQEK